MITLYGDPEETKRAAAISKMWRQGRKTPNNSQQQDKKSTKIDRELPIFKKADPVDCDLDCITPAEFKTFIAKLVTDKKGALPDFNDWKEIKKQLGRMEADSPAIDQTSPVVDPFHRSQLEAEKFDEEPSNEWINEWSEMLTIPGLSCGPAPEIWVYGNSIDWDDSTVSNTTTTVTTTTTASDKCDYNIGSCLSNIELRENVKTFV